jgi:hypothetical protein
MHLTVEIPDDLAGRFSAAGADLSRRPLELLALEEYKSGHLTEAELQRLLGFGTRYRLDGFLKAHGILIDDYTVDDLRCEVATLQRLGF